ncbi:MAG: hypothetical protein WCJ58_06255 [bacterium]
MSTVIKKYPHLRKSYNVIGQLDKKAKQKQIMKPLITLIIVISIISIVIMGYKFVPRSSITKGIEEIKKTVSLNVEPTENVQITVTLAPTAKPILEIKGTKDETPMINTFYLVKDADGFYSLFITNDHLNKYVNEESANEISDAYHGLVGQGKYQQADAINFKDYQNNIRLITLPQKYLVDSSFNIIDYYINDDNSKLLISFVYPKQSSTDPASDLDFNTVVEIDLTSKEANFFWERQINDTKYPDYLGAVTFGSIVNQYLEAGIGECYGCGDPKEAKIIINIKTGKDELLGQATELSFDLDNKKVSYTLGGERKNNLLP